MTVVDAHCDSLTRAVNSKKSLVRNDLHWDMERALKYDGFVQVLAVFQNPDRRKPSFDNAMKYIREAERIERQTCFFKLCRSFEDIKNGIEDKKVCGLLGIEGGEALEGKLENLDEFYNAGVRIMTLTWNYANELGDGAEIQRNGGLTEFGRKVVKLMQEKGMIVDISHADIKTFEDCMSISTRPVIASHSNARAVCDHPRNLYDWQIMEIKRTGGVVGINFYAQFINNSKKAGVTSLIRHIEHICEIAGDGAVGIGADFDGMDALPAGIRGVEDLDIVFNELAKLNYSDTAIQKIAGGNFLRVFSDVLSV
ncbi:M19 family membrane dipeptidase [Thermoclostridium stercorarium subsp. leptospartum DSM 9219]|uniref:M19 family membrane dipeptidase n=1 Tax=Thermoclostridium stercorarium subsp. leptospartum DSM 9219 TaxID=1346611 RepID=A0A1B1YMJ6_THEST|nr:dipeptidase [Thermoclostridium stercorarium]ANX01962.1 M19 family membrane dipeptidase [Thermoclostridium stercorarium subsp. leptospartum DSM 9219]